MKVKLNKEVFLESLQTSQNIVTGRSPLPILSNILLETSKENKLKLISTDLDIGIVNSIPSINEQEGAVVLPAKRFLDIIKELPENEEITITIKKNFSTIIEAGKCSFKITGIIKDEYPTLPTISSVKSIEIEQRILKNMINMTEFSASIDETRYILNGILFSIKENILRLVATDGRRLALIDEKLSISKNYNLQLIIPIKTIRQLNRILKDSGYVKIIFGENHVVFEIKNSIIISRLIEGDFPNYEQVIPEVSNNKLKITKKDLLNSSKRASLFTTPDSLSMRLDLLSNKVIISKSTPEIGEVKEEVSAKYTGRNLSIGFNPNYIIDVLKNIDKEDIEMEFSGEDKPGVIRVEDKYIYIVLPMELT